MEPNDAGAEEHRPGWFHVEFESFSSCENSESLRKNVQQGLADDRLLLQENAAGKIETL